MTVERTYQQAEQTTLAGEHIVDLVDIVNAQLADGWDIEDAVPLLGGITAHLVPVIQAADEIADEANIEDEGFTRAASNFGVSFMTALRNFGNDPEVRDRLLMARRARAARSHAC